MDPLFFFWRFVGLRWYGDGTSGVLGCFGADIQMASMRLYNFIAKA